MKDIKKWLLLKGVGRVWPGRTHDGGYYMQCHYCLASKDRRRCYCSPQCRYALNNSARQKGPYDRILCPICHRSFEPRQKNQKWCSSHCRKLAWYRQKNGHPIDSLTPLMQELGLLPFQYVPEGTQAAREQQRVRKLCDKRLKRSNQRYIVDDLTPAQKERQFLDRTKKLPPSLQRQIAEILANETAKNKD